MMKGVMIQDTTRQNKIIRQDTSRLQADSITKNNFARVDSVVKIRKNSFIPLSKSDSTDNSSVCARNSIADVTFYDSNNLVTLIDEKLISNFPFAFIEINRKIQKESKAELISHLKSGEELKVDFFHLDWVVVIIFVSVFILGVIKSESGNFFKGLVKFIIFRGITESTSRDLASIFQWQSTLFNLASFINISLFAFLTAIWYEVLPGEGNRFAFWILSFVIVLSAVTIRHFVCVISGNMSGEAELFKEYLFGIYQAYRITGLLLLIITILILYTSFLPMKILFSAGFCLTALLYIIRVLRLFLIFLNRHVSIFYLILYLCALEILPVVILVKYVTGLA